MGMRETSGRAPQKSAQNGLPRVRCAIHVINDNLGQQLHFLSSYRELSIILVLSRLRTDVKLLPVQLHTLSPRYGLLAEIRFLSHT